jgi:DNA-binding NarL/FixJ family response regulator
MKIRILLVDDQNLFVEMLRTVLTTRSEDFEVVGIARNGREAVEMNLSLDPEVILMDIRMPLMDGVEAVKRIHAVDPRVKIMMLTTFNDTEYVHEAIKKGASGYLLKTISPEELFSSIKALYQGASLVSQDVLNCLCASDPLQQSPSDPELSVEAVRALKDLEISLNHREREIFEAMGEGLDNGEIASRLCIAEQTVKNNVSSLYSKMGIHERECLVKIAKRYLAATTGTTSVPKRL